MGNEFRSNVPELSVSDLSFSLKRTLEETFGHVRVRGELSRVKIHTSGHMYTDLKDQQSVINAVCWRGTLSKMQLKPEEGMDVICTGRISTYPARSNYQLIIEKIELAGEGALLKLLEERKKKLAAEGLFEQERKRALPFLPKKIGVVTSPTGAVIRDIMHRLNDRFPRHVVVWPVLVQGDGAAEQVSAAVNGFNAMPEDQRPDLLIVARGGGSLEDLMPFNEENVVRAVADSVIPVISAIGHETDTTLIDYVSDYRAPTPTGAAEKAVPVRMDLLAAIQDYDRRLLTAIQRGLKIDKDKVSNLSARLGDPRRLLEPRLQRLDLQEQKLSSGFERLLSRAKERLSKSGGRLKDPQAFLDNKQNELLRNVDKLSRNFQRVLTRHRENLLQRSAKLQPPKHRVVQVQRDLDYLTDRLTKAGEKIQQDGQKRLEHSIRMLEMLSHENILKRGFTLVLGEDGKLISDSDSLVSGQNVSLRFKDNKQRMAVIDGDTTKKRPKPTVKEKKMEKTTKKAGQGQLF
jgi:exodeoxyribonuclease VII large subunit